MSRSAWSAAVYRRFQKHARPAGIATYKLSQASADNSAFQNQARNQANQTKIKPSQAENSLSMVTDCGVRSRLLGSSPFNSVQPILGYSSLIHPIQAFPPGGYGGQWALPAKIMNAYLSRFFHSKPFKVIQRHSKQFKAIQRLLRASFFYFMCHLPNLNPMEAYPNDCNAIPIHSRGCDATTQIRPEIKGIKPKSSRYKPKNLRGLNMDIRFCCNFRPFLLAYPTACTPLAHGGNIKYRH